jgi:two-component system LytT family response regulator
MRAITALVVDDEPLARARLIRLLGESGGRVEVVGEAGNGEEAIRMAAELRPDVVFLDIRMPVLDGFDVAELLGRPRPHIVFVTAYDEHALRAFEVHALDYLTKPVRAARLRDTLERIQPASAPALRTARDEEIDSLLREREGRHLRRLTLHAGRRLRVVDLADVRWIEARGKLVYVHLPDGEGRTDFTLDELSARLDPEHFLRIHRSTIVNCAHVRELLPWFAGTYAVRMDDGERLAVARRRVGEVRRMLGGISETHRQRGSGDDGINT